GVEGGSWEMLERPLAYHPLSSLFSLIEGAAFEESLPRGGRQLGKTRHGRMLFHTDTRHELSTVGVCRTIIRHSPSSGGRRIIWLIVCARMGYRFSNRTHSRRCIRSRSRSNARFTWSSRRAWPRR